MAQRDSFITPRHNANPKRPDQISECKGRIAVTGRIPIDQIAIDPESIDVELDMESGGIVARAGEVAD